jgi:hypothetical protein
MQYNMETSKNLTRQLTLDELIYSQEASHANPTHSPESERERRTSATCGERCCALFENAPRATSWARTFAGLLIGIKGWSSRRCALTWKLKGTQYNRSYFQLAASAHLTEEIAYSSWLPTPNAFDWNTSRSPQAWAKAKEKHKDSLQIPLEQMAAFNLLPTPKCQEERGNASKDRGKFNLTDEVARIWKPPGKSSQLSPLFVEEMMGFPAYWTASPFQSGEEKA